MSKSFIYVFTLVTHYLLAFLWIEVTGLIGAFLMIAHWTLLGGKCFLTYIERWVHLRILGETHLSLDFSKTFLYKFIKMFF